jgi:kinetochore protein Spc25, fungi type
VYLRLSNQTEKNKERSTLTTQSSHISPELSACEQRLSCVVEGIEKDRVLVRFCQVDPSDSEREFSFVIDLSHRIYKGKYACNAIGSSNSCIPVLTSSPPLPSLPVLVDALNGNRDVYGFIKQVRAAYEARMKPTL